MPKPLPAIRYAARIYWKFDTAFGWGGSGGWSQALLKMGIEILSGHYSSLPLP